MEKNLTDIAYGSGAVGYSLATIPWASLMTVTQAILNIMLALLGCILLIYRIRKIRKENKDEE